MKVARLFDRVRSFLKFVEVIFLLCILLRMPLTRISFIVELSKFVISNKVLREI